MKKRLYRGISIVAFIIAVLLLLMFILLSSVLTGPDIIPFVIIFGVPVALFVFIGYIFNKKYKNSLLEGLTPEEIEQRKKEQLEQKAESWKEEQKRNAEEERKRRAKDREEAEFKQRAKENKAKLKADLEKQKSDQNEREEDTLTGVKLVAGLPIVQGTECSVYFNFKDRKAIFKDSKAEFNLAFDKIIDVQLKTSTEIENAYISSVGGAIGGAALFGTLGAIVGGRAKKKKIKTIEYYFIVTYSKGETVEYISLQTSEFSKDVNKARRLAEKFENRNRTGVQIFDL